MFTHHKNNIAIQKERHATTKFKLLQKDSTEVPSIRISGEERIRSGE